MKKITSIILVFMMILSVVMTGCNKTKKDSSISTNKENSSTEKLNKKEELQVTEPGTYPVVNEKVTLRVFAAVPTAVEDMNTNWTTKWYEEKTNVHIEWDVAGEDAKEKLNILLAAQADIPDIIMPGGMANEQLVRYGSQGIFLPLNDLIENYGHNIKKMFEYDNTVSKQIIAPDGNIYGLPTYNECYHCQYSNKFWMNKVWLDNLGLQIPTTTDEFYEVLKAFKENDANGNGNKDDEIPLTGSLGWNSSVDYFLMNAFIYNDGSRLMFEDDKIICSAVEPEWREGLQYLRKLYRENLIDKESFTMDGTQMKMLTENPEGNQIGSTPNGAVGFVDSSKDTKEEYIAIAPLKGPKGIRQSVRYPVSAGTGYFMITNVCKNPEVAMRWADGFYTDITDWRGEQDVDWRYAKDGELGLDGNPATWHHMATYGEAQNKSWLYFEPEFQPTKWRDGMVSPQGEWFHEKVLFDASKNQYEPYAPEKVIPPLVYAEDVLDEVSELKTNTDEYIKESIARFITDDLSLEDDWDNYLEELNKMGLEKYLEIVNTTYNRQYK